MGDLRIEEAVESDRLFVVDCLIKLQAHEAAMHDSRRPADPALCVRYLASIDARAREHGGAVLVAQVAGQQIGFACYWIADEPALVEREDSSRYGYVSDLFVSEPHRGAGVAGALLDEVKRRLSQGGSVKRLRLGVLAVNGPAVAAYERAGFVPYEIVYEQPLP